MAYKIYFNAPFARTSLGVSLGHALIAKEYCYEVNFAGQSITLRPGFEFEGNVDQSNLNFKFPDGFRVSIKKACVVRVENVRVPF